MKKITYIFFYIKSIPFFISKSKWTYLRRYVRVRKDKLKNSSPSIPGIVNSLSTR